MLEQPGPLLGCSAARESKLPIDFNAIQRFCLRSGRDSGRDGKARAGSGPATGRQRAGGHARTVGSDGDAQAASDAIPAKAVTIIHVLHGAEARGACITEQ